MSENERNEKTCAELVKKHYRGRIHDLKKMYKAECDGEEDKELGPLNEYGLGFDFVEAGTFKKQREPYWRYQLSWGGPADEFRIYLNGEIEYWYLDWFDGAPYQVEGEDYDLIRNIIEPLIECNEEYQRGKVNWDD